MRLEQIFWIATCAFLMTACSAQTEIAKTSLQSLDQLRLGMPESTMASSAKLFFFDPHGHFGSKVQYNSHVADANSGSYVVHCRDGKCFGIEVTYPQSGVTREAAVARMQLLVSDVANRFTEHDDEDLRAKDSEKAGEFFYFGKNTRAELTFAPGSTQKVSQLGVWTN